MADNIPQKNSNKENEGCLHGCLIYCAVFFGSAIILGIILVFVIGIPIEKEDLELTYNPNLTEIGIDCNVTAKVNVKDVELEFTFYDFNGKAIFRLKKYVGNIDKGETKKATVNIFEIESTSIPITCAVKISDGEKSILSFIF